MPEDVHAVSIILVIVLPVLKKHTVPAVIIAMLPKMALVYFACPPSTIARSVLLPPLLISAGSARKATICRMTGVAQVVRLVSVDVKHVVVLLFVLDAK